MSLELLNSSLPSADRFRSIIFLFSRFSKISSDLIERIPQECRGVFHYISVDEQKVRDSILKSKQIKINVVPCIMTIDEKNNVLIYEGEKTLEIIKSVYTILMNQRLIKEKKQIPQVGGFDSNTTSLDLNRSKYTEDTRDMRSQNNIRYQPQSSKSTEYFDQDVSEVPRQKVRRAVRPMDPPPKHEERDFHSGGISSAKPTIVMGRGHEKMMVSSLHQPTGVNPQNTQDYDEQESSSIAPRQSKIIQKSPEGGMRQRRTSQIQDLTPPSLSNLPEGGDDVYGASDMFDVDDSTEESLELDPDDMRGDPGEARSDPVPKSTKMDAVKRASEIAMREREMDIEKGEKLRTGRFN